MLIFCGRPITDLTFVKYLIVWEDAEKMSDTFLTLQDEKKSNWEMGQTWKLLNDSIKGQAAYYGCSVSQKLIYRYNQNLGFQSKGLVASYRFYLELKCNGKKEKKEQ